MILAGKAKGELKEADLGKVRARRRVHKDKRVDPERVS